MSMMAGTLDYTDQTSLDGFDDEVQAMDAYIRLHARHFKAIIPAERPSNVRYSFIARSEADY